MITTTFSSPTVGTKTSTSGGDICADLDTDEAADVAAVPPPALSALEALQRPGVMAKALRMLSVDELLGDVPLVCAAWRKAAVYAFAEVASDMTVRDITAAPAVAAGTGGRALRGRVAKGKAAVAAAARGDPSRDVWSVEKLTATFPWGGFLSEGACKQVRGRFCAIHGASHCVRWGGSE